MVLQRSKWLAPGLIAVAVLVVYGRTFSAPLLFDDAFSITHNPSIRSLWPLTSVFAPPSECTVAGRPFANLTFALNYAVGGTHVTGYHMVNLLFHLCAALLLYGVVRRTLAGIGKPNDGVERFRRRLAENAPTVALFAALVWAVHPVATASVTYLSQRTEVLMGMFYLGTLYAFIRGVAESSRRWMAASIAACYLGVLSKEGMVTAPVAVLLYDRTFVAGSFAAALKRRWSYYLAVAGIWLVLAVLMVGLKDRAVGFGLGVPWWIYAWTECGAVLRYAWLSLWPSPLVFDYGAIFVVGFAEGLPAAVGLLPAVGVTVWALYRAPAAGFVAAMFFLLLAPTSSVVPIATQPIAENRIYLASAAIVTLVVMGLFCFNRALARVGLGVAALLFGLLTLQRNELFRDPLGLWEDNARKRPQNPRSHAILGEMLYERRRLPEAKAAFEHALRLKPDYHEAHNNLGTTLYQLGQPQAAKVHLEEALRLEPKYASAHNNLANLLLQTGDVAGAVRHGEEALRLYAQPGRLQPDLAETHNNLGNAKLYQGQVAAALAHYLQAVEQKPGFLQARMNLGVTLRLTGKLEESRRHLEAVVAAEPNFPEALFNLGVLYEQLGRLEDAIRSFERAVALRPEFPEALLNLGQLLARKGDLIGAKNRLEVVTRLRPNDGSARAMLDQVIAALAGVNRPGARP
jgi:tetratricopeptide (TPR) repeat protein